MQSSRQMSASCKPKSRHWSPLRPARTKLISDLKDQLHIKVLSINNDESSCVNDTCPLFKLTSSKTISDNIACKRAEFVPGSCCLMKTIFKNQPANCSHQSTHIICEVKIYNEKQPQAFCHHDICKKYYPISIGLYISEIGKYTWHKLDSAKELAFFINSELLVDFRNNYPNNGYCLIQCFSEIGIFISQLLVLPPVLQNKHEHLKRTQKEKTLLNVNILLLDSVSRHHFYRSLPRTIKQFRDLNKQYLNSGHVFDFELVQGIAGRTLESLQALFGGEVFTLPIFNSFEMPPKSVSLNETFGKFKIHGYETLYVEDMCWHWEWGLVKEQRAMNLSAPYTERVKLFNEAVRKAGIDRVDISHSSCLILRENKVTDVFHGPKSICYNGIHQHTYLILYMELFMRRFTSLGKPTFTFLILDTGHEETGIRIKQLDEDLARHVFFLAHQPNTVSFILSDHGNTYGHFVSASTESQIEIFHPFLFIIVPDDTSKLLGERRIKTLHTNQNRLVSLIDVHFTLKGLLSLEEQTHGASTKYNINIDGLLSPISPSRTCKDMPRLHPNLCICQASYVVEKNSSYYALFAEFALGYINRKIVDLQTGDNEHVCVRLRATRFDNVKISYQEDMNQTILLLDLYVKPDGLDGYEEDMFTVTLLYSSNIPMEGILILGYNRMTPYSIYRQCADSAVDQQLCICDKSSLLTNKTKKVYKDSNVSETVLWTMTYRSRIHDPCLCLLTRNYTAGVVLSISNICSNIHYEIVFDFFSINLYASNKMPVFQVLKPKVEKMLVVGIRKVKNKPWNYKYTLRFKAHTIKQNS
ncbi:uncharacterized protein RCH25_052976 [Pelodytes ibericus]